MDDWIREWAESLVIECDIDTASADEQAQNDWERYSGQEGWTGRDEMILMNRKEYFVMCDNQVTLYVPRGYDYVPVEFKCGNTDHYGERVICDECASDPAEMAEIERHEHNVAADNAWLRSAGWGEM